MTGRPITDPLPYGTGQQEPPGFWDAEPPDLPELCPICRAPLWEYSRHPLTGIGCDDCGYTEGNPL